MNVMTDHKVQVPEGESGAVRIERFTVEENSPGRLREMLHGRDVPPGTYTRLLRNGVLWMSDTRAEWYDHVDAYWKMKGLGGRVLVNGLGLGLIVRAALALPNVEHVDVVELDADVIRLVGPTYAGPRCTIHHADAYTIKWPVGTKWTVAWHDIWATMCEDDLPDRTRLMRRYGNRVRWQACWGQDVILAERRRTRDAWWRR